MPDLANDFVLAGGEPVGSEVVFAVVPGEIYEVRRVNTRPKNWNLQFPVRDEADTNGVRRVDLHGYQNDSSQALGAVTEAAVRAALAGAE